MGIFIGYDEILSVCRIFVCVNNYDAHAASVLRLYRFIRLSLVVQLTFYSQMHLCYELNARMYI